METGRKRIGKWTAEGMRKGVRPWVWRDAEPALQGCGCVGIRV